MSHKKQSSLTMVIIQSRQTIIPSSPTSNTKLYSLCEQIKLHTHEPLLYVYKPHNQNKNNTSSTFIEILRNSLSQALVIYYPLAGRLNWIKGGRWELHCNAKGAHLLEAKCEEIEKLEDLADFVSTPLASQLIPNIDYNGTPIEEIPLLLVQLTMFRCGGLTLGVCLCDAAIDGISTMRFMNTWAKLARGESLNPSEMPCHDRTILDSYKLKNSAFLHPHFEFHMPPLWVDELENTNMTLVDTSVKLTREQVANLKKKATSLLKGGKPYSTFEVVTGHLWRCVSKARYVGNGDQPTRVHTVVNCRNRLRPPLPSTYAGNAVFPTVTSTRSFHELMNKPLSYAVENVREALEKVTEEYVYSALDYIEREKDMHSLRDNIYCREKFVCEFVEAYKRNPNILVVSWMNFLYKDADFGWGKPVYFGLGKLQWEGCAYIISDANGDGVFIVICLETSHMDAFRKIFYDDIEVLFTTSKL